MALMKADDSARLNTAYRQRQMEDPALGDLLDAPAQLGHIFSNRLRHARHVICGAGGSAQRERLPGSSEHSATRQLGVTAW